MTLLNGLACAVDYTRYNSRYHKFAYAAPLCQRVYTNDPLENSLAAIEREAQERAKEAFQRAQQAEMRRKTAPPGRKAPSPSSETALRAKTAQEYAGMYSVCLRFASGQMTPVGAAYESPDPPGRNSPVASTASGNSKRDRLWSSASATAGNGAGRNRSSCQCPKRPSHRLLPEGCSLRSRPRPDFPARGLFLLPLLGSRATDGLAAGDSAPWSEHHTNKNPRSWRRSRVSVNGQKCPIVAGSQKGLASVPFLMGLLLGTPACCAFAW